MEILTLDSGLSMYIKFRICLKIISSIQNRLYWISWLSFLLRDITYGLHQSSYCIIFLWLKRDKFQFLVPENLNFLYILNQDIINHPSTPFNWYRKYTIFKLLKTYFYFLILSIYSLVQMYIGNMNDKQMTCLCMFKFIQKFENHLMNLYSTLLLLSIIRTH